MLTRRAFLGALAGVAAAALVGVKVATEAPPSVEAEGWSGGASLEVGDIFTIEGVHAVNPVTGTRTALLQQFVVTATTDDRATAILSAIPRIVYTQREAEAMAPLMRPLKVGRTIPTWQAPENRRERNGSDHDGMVGSWPRVGTVHPHATG